MNCKHGDGRHGRQAREYRAWAAMKRRCYNRRVERFPHYGGRGITVCDRWRESYVAFLEDMGRCPDGLTLERNDTDGHYEPSNCRWATMQEQRVNRRDYRTCLVRQMFGGTSYKQLSEAQKYAYHRERNRRKAA